MMRWLVWETGDNRDDAREFTAAFGHNYAESIAEEYAEKSWEGCDAFSSIDVTVVEIADDGTEATYRFVVNVDYSPTFIAREVVSDE